MKRPTVALLALALLAAPLAVEAQPAGKVYRVAIISTMSPISVMAGPDPASPPSRAFVHSLRALGYVEGKNLVLERRSAEGNFDRLADIMAELVRLKPDVIVTSDRLSTQRAKEATTTIPIVMASISDPVAAGFVQSLARPGGNITGLSADAATEIDAKRLALLKGALPKVARIAYLGRQQDWDAYWGSNVRAAASVLSVKLWLAEHTPTDYTQAFRRIDRALPDALYVARSAPNYANRRQIADFEARSRLPSTHAFREAVELGALMSYGVNTPDLYWRAAHYVDKTLKGVKLADLPIEAPTKFEQVINAKAAKALGLTIPQSILLRADAVIQ